MAVAVETTRVRPIVAEDGAMVLRHLEREPRLNLPLIDMALRLAEPPTGIDLRTALVGAFQGDELLAVASTQPSVVLDATASPGALEALFPHLSGVGTGLVKSTEEVVDPLWTWLEKRGRRALLDRIEIGFALDAQTPEIGLEPEPDSGLRVRSAAASDLDDLVQAARASLREENRPDAFRGDPVGFRRWVRGRLPRATVVEEGGRVVFVGYADVQCARGWLLQGVYTWPARRRKGLARVGVAEICRRAFASGADHVQLAVVEGNLAAERLYRGLGFESFARLRTLLFS
ncbi:MAG: GNAT family N-acetyltransferase [Myxococcota bacterium]|nr:GNAT family N-acetyltransferase [Myxococcota bacterium]